MCQVESRFAAATGGLQATYQRRFGDRLSPNGGVGRGFETRWRDWAWAGGLFLTRGRGGELLLGVVAVPVLTLDTKEALLLLAFTSYVCC